MLVEESESDRAEFEQQQKYPIEGNKLDVVQELSALGLYMTLFS